MRHHRCGWATAGLVLAALSAGPGAARAAEFKVDGGMGLTNIMAFVGVPEANGARMAADELNAQSYLGAGNTISFSVNDDGNDRGQQLSLMNRAANIDNALMFIGTANSGVAIAVSPVANDLKLPYFGTAQTTEPLKAGPWWFKINTSPEGAVTPVARYAVDKLDLKRPAIVYVRDNDGHVNNMRIFKNYLVSKGKTFVGEESVLTADTDFAALATKIAGLKPDGIWIGANAVQAANIVIQLKQAGVAQDVKLFGTAGLGDDYMKGGGAAVDNTYISTDYNVQSTSPMNVAFVENYKKRFSVTPDNWAAMGYTMMMITGRAIKESMPDPTREKVRVAMTNMKNVPVIIGGGTWGYDENRIPVYDSPVMVLKGGKFTAAP